MRAGPAPEAAGEAARSADPGPAFLNARDFSNLPERGTVDPKTIRFSQHSIKAAFRDPRYGSVHDLSRKLRRGDLHPSTIGPIRIVMRGGSVFTLDNRRLKAFQEAGVEIPFVKLDAVPERELRKFTTQNEGVSVKRTRLLAMQQRRLEIEGFVESIETKEDFERFLQLLIEDFHEHGEAWENRNLQHFLDGMLGFTQDMAGYYRNVKCDVDWSRPTWRVLADVLLAARVYE